MLNWIERLSTTCAPCGREEPLRQLLAQQLQDKVDQLQVDPLGDLLARLSPRGSGNGQRVLLVAHMDEPGLVVLGFDEDGLVRVAPVGPLSPRAALGQRFAFPDGTVGTLVARHPDRDGPGEGDRLRFDHLRLDLGASRPEEARQLVRPGQMATFDRELKVRGPLISGKALDNRLGCAVLLALLERLAAPCEVTVAFTAQGLAGGRGAQAVAFAVEPTLALVVDASEAADTAAAPPGTVRLGAGPTLRAKDGSLLLSPASRERLAEVAASRGLPFQDEVSSAESEAGRIQLSRAGVPTAVLGLPVRHLHTGAEWADLRDAQVAVEWLAAWLATP